MNFGLVRFKQKISNLFIIIENRYMKGDANPGSVYNGIEKMVGETLKLI